jgi:hypothetical protein
MKRFAVVLALCVALVCGLYFNVAVNHETYDEQEIWEYQNDKAVWAKRELRKLLQK